jgi:hypothetical protein
MSGRNLGEFILIVPTRVEASLTGFIGAGERQSRGKVWRAECRAGQPVRIFKEGEPVEWAAAPAWARRFATDVLGTLRRAYSD